MQGIKAIEKELQTLKRATSRKGGKAATATGVTRGSSLPPLPPLAPPRPNGPPGPRRVYSPEVQRLIDAGYTLRGDDEGTTLFKRVGQTERYDLVGEYKSNDRAWEAAERHMKRTSEPQKERARAKAKKRAK